MTDIKLPKGVRKTQKGIIINMRCSGVLKACYYRDGNYPPFPKDLDAVINDYMVTENAKWHWDLETRYRPDRVYNWRD